MRKHLTTLVLALLVGVLGFAVSGVAVAAGQEKPATPPGQGECEHGNSAKPCKEDPQPDKGKDCEDHGNHGGVNEDHCAGNEPTIPDETTPDDTTPDDTTPDDTTPTETTPQDAVPTETTSTSSTSPSNDGSEATSTEVTEAAPSEPVESMPASVESPQAAPAVKKKAAVTNEAAVLDATVEAAAPKPNRQAQQAPVTL
jgi:hypothetical protein